MGEYQPIGLHIWGCCKAMGLQKKNKFGLY